VRILLALVALIAVFAVVNGGDDGDDGTDTAETTVQAPQAEEAALPGSPAVYEEIAASTDCAWLQETFDRNRDRYEARDPSERTQDGNPGQWEKAYAEAADDRMSEIGCYG